MNSHPSIAQAAPPVLALQHLLTKLASLVGRLSLDVYCSRFAAPHSGSIGEHVRHCLDHVATLLAVDTSETLSYDRRQRGTDAEMDPVEAVRLVVHGATAAIATSDARALSYEVVHLFRPLMQTSSSLGDELVEGPRGNLFDRSTRTRVGSNMSGAASCST